MINSWLKMYDKFGQILRVEAVINRSKEFYVHRTRRHRYGTTSHDRRNFSACCVECNS
jgi:hypothetical protein